MSDDERERLRAEMEDLRKQHEAAVASGQVIKAKRFARQMAAIKRKLD